MSDPTPTAYAVDFETYYDSEVSIDTLGTYAYLRHPECDIYLASVYPCGLPYEVEPWVGHPKDIPWADIAGATWVAHNMAFDGQVWDRLVELGVTRAEDGPSATLCSSDLCGYVGVPRSLAGAVKTLFKVDLAKHVRAGMKGRKVGDLDLSEWEALVRYGGDDAVWCARVFDRLQHLWPEHERRASLLTRRMELRGALVDLPSARVMVEGLEKERVSLAEGIPWSDGEWVEGEWVQGKNKPSAILSRDEWYRSHSEPVLDADGEPVLDRDGAPAIRHMVPPSTDKNDEALTIWKEQMVSEGRDYLVQPLEDLSAWRTIARMKGNIEKLAWRAELGIPHAGGGRAPVSLKYAAAHTLRWGGTGKFNWLNMDSSPVGDADIRSLIVPAPGNVFASADYSQIEPRCLAWLAGALEFMRLMSTYDVYEAHARASMGYTSPLPLKGNDDAMRKFAKVRVLGGGYGAGPPKFRDMAKIYADLDLTLEEAKEVVHDFRRTNPHIPELWKNLDDTLRRSVAHGDKVMELQLPSGRSMNYIRPSSKVKRYPAVLHPETGEVLKPAGSKQVYTAMIPGETRRREVELWGGTLTENLCQGMARDIMVDGLLRIEDWCAAQRWTDPACGVILHVYDEFLLEVPESQGEEAVQMLEKNMRQAPEWAPDIPLGAEAKLLEHYEK